MEAEAAITLPQPSIPDEGDLFQGLLVEYLDPFGGVAAAGPLVEGKCAAIVFERPDHHALQPGRGELFAGGGKQPAAEPDALIFRPQVELVDFALLREAAGAVAAQRGVAGNRSADLDDQHRGGPAHGVRP